MRVARFSVSAQGDTGTLLRVINLFTKRGLEPTLVHATNEDELLTIDIVQLNLLEETANGIAAAVRALVMVREVQLTFDLPSTA